MNGGIEPTDSDCDWPSDEEEEDEKLAVSNDFRNYCRLSLTCRLCRYPGCIKPR